VARPLADDARVYAMTSAGSHRAFATYGAVGAAKAALERTSATCSGDGAAQRQGQRHPGRYSPTPGLRQIPRPEKAMQPGFEAASLWPDDLPEDVANALVALASPAARDDGQTIRVDGGEDILA